MRLQKREVNFYMEIDTLFGVTGEARSVMLAGSRRNTCSSQKLNLIFMKTSISLMTMLLGTEINHI